MSLAEPVPGRPAPRTIPEVEADLRVLWAALEVMPGPLQGPLWRRIDAHLRLLADLAGERVAHDRAQVEADELAVLTQCWWASWPGTELPVWPGDQDDPDARGMAA